MPEAQHHIYTIALIWPVNLHLLDARGRYSLQQAISGANSAAAAAYSCFRSDLLGCLDELHVESDRDLFAHQDAAGLEGRVPRQPEVLAVDLGGGGKPDAGISPGILAGALGRRRRKSPAWSRHGSSGRRSPRSSPAFASTLVDLKVMRRGTFRRRRSRRS